MTKLTEKKEIWWNISSNGDQRRNLTKRKEKELWNFNFSLKFNTKCKYIIKVYWRLLWVFSKIILTLLWYSFDRIRLWSSNSWSLFMWNRTSFWRYYSRINILSYLNDFRRYLEKRIKSNKKKVDKFRWCFWFVFIWKNSYSSALVGNSKKN